MGNQQNNQLGFNPHAMQEYNKKLQNIRGQYSEHHSGDFPGAYRMQAPQTKTLNYSQINRKIYIYKPSIDIDHKPGQGNFHDLTISMKYDNKVNQNSFIQIDIGVEQVKQDQQTKKTLDIISIQKSQERAKVGEKINYEKTFSVTKQIINRIYNMGILIKIFNQQSLETSEYSLTYFQKTKLWKVVMETYLNPQNQKVYQLEDMFGGGQQGANSEIQQCIICFTEQSHVMIKPCNHICLCDDCLQMSRNSIKNCPICRKIIRGYIKLEIKNQQ